MGNNRNGINWQLNQRWINGFQLIQYAPQLKPAEIGHLVDTTEMGDKLGRLNSYLAIFADDNLEF